jgi:phosphoglycerate dehydrogenase-like enzyme
MQIIVVDNKCRFSQQNIQTLQDSGRVVFTKLDKNILKNLPSSYYNNETILAPDPDVFSWDLKAEDLKRFRKLKAVCLPTTRASWVDTKFCQKHKILITNTPGYSSQAVAEYALWMMFSLMRKLPFMLSGQMNIFDPSSIQEEIQGKTMGIIGLGNIGNAIAQLGKNLGMNVIYWSRSRKNCIYKRVSLTSVLKKSDALFPCFDINEETKKLLSRKRLELIRNTSYLIIPIIGSEVQSGKDTFDFRYLYKRIRERKLAGLAFEAPTMTKRKGNIFTPPAVAWFTKESQKRCYNMLTETIQSVIQNNPQYRVI